MKQSIKILMTILVLLSLTACSAQIKNVINENIKIYGNCDMCKSSIEKAGNLKKTAQVNWNKDTKMATITYDAKKTNSEEILKRIALSGYDNEKFLAPNDVYAKLPECCQYERKAQTVAKVETKTDSIKVIKSEDYSAHNHNATTATKQGIPQLKAVFDNYFAIKDALIKSDGNTASSKAMELLSAIKTVKMDKLATEEHTIWMDVMKNLVFDVEQIANTKDVSHQRNHFRSLSKNVYALMKVSKTTTPTYYQFCPMANDGKGANWLSKENAVKNPYFGSQMLTCGETIEILK